MVEEGQHFGKVRTATPPQTVPGLGLDADWFPDHAELMTTDGARLIVVTVRPPAAAQARARWPKPWRGRTWTSPTGESQAARTPRSS